MRISLKKTIAIAFACFGLTVQAQQVEVGLMLGASNYAGDLSNEKFLMKETHFSGALFGRYNINNRWAIKGFVGYGRVSGDDKNFNEKRNNKRNLNFYSDLYEFSVHAEYNILKNDLMSYSARPFLPYVFLGVGVFNFNPKTEFQGKTYELQPLGTEGQGTTTFNDLLKYDLTTVCFPIGIGFRQKIGDDFFIGIEGGLRFTRTNYLDDVGGFYADPQIVRAAYGDVAGLLSDRSWETFGGNQNVEGNSRSFKEKFRNDVYMMAGITLSYVIRTKGQGCPQF
ncbi:MAG: porin family protein [Bacteroidia bacterium]|nr:porin family protein [Bacteroidia bacterium]